MLYIEAPAEHEGPQPSVFLAGGITGCEKWQPRMSELLSGLDIAVINPRREDYPWDDPSAAEEQIHWEYRQLVRATACLFWFPPQTLCPIALYELGKWSAGDRPMFVGVDPEYGRRQDVEIQTALVRPEVKVVYTLEDLAARVIEHFQAENEVPANQRE